MKDQDPNNTWMWVTLIACIIFAWLTHLPQMSDLRDSGQIEQDADVAMFLYRPEYYGVDTNNDGSSTEGIVEIIVGKQKDGQTGTVRCFFDKERMSFENLQRSKDGVPF